MTTNPYSKGFDEVTKKSIWHEPSEKPTKTAKLVFLAPDAIWAQNLFNTGHHLMYKLPWCYEDDLTKMLHDMRKSEKEPKQEPAKKPQDPVPCVCGGILQQGPYTPPKNGCNYWIMCQGCKLKCENSGRDWAVEAWNGLQQMKREEAEKAKADHIKHIGTVKLYCGHCKEHTKIDIDYRETRRLYSMRCTKCHTAGGEWSTMLNAVEAWERNNSDHVETPSSNLKTILDVRQVVNGKLAEQAKVSQALKLALYKNALDKDLSDLQREALEMILHKIARVIAGNPNHCDHWDDIAGYATLVTNDIRKATATAG